MTEASALVDFPPSKGSSGTMLAAIAIAVRPPALPMNERRLGFAGGLPLFLRFSLTFTSSCSPLMGSLSCKFTCGSVDILFLLVFWWPDEVEVYERVPDFPQLELQLFLKRHGH